MQQVSAQCVSEERGSGTNHHLNHMTPRCHRLQGAGPTSANSKQTEVSSIAWASPLFTPSLSLRLGTSHVGGGKKKKINKKRGLQCFQHRGQQLTYTVCIAPSSVWLKVFYYLHFSQSVNEGWSLWQHI